MAGIIAPGNSVFGEETVEEGSFYGSRLPQHSPFFFFFFGVPLFQAIFLSTLELTAFVYRFKACCTQAKFSSCVSGTMDSEGCLLLHS